MTNFLNEGQLNFKDTSPKAKMSKYTTMQDDSAIRQAQEVQDKVNIAASLDNTNLNLYSGGINAEKLNNFISADNSKIKYSASGWYPYTSGDNPEIFYYNNFYSLGVADAHATLEFVSNEITIIGNRQYYGTDQTFDVYIDGVLDSTVKHGDSSVDADTADYKYILYNKTLTNYGNHKIKIVVDSSDELGLTLNGFIVGKMISKHHLWCCTKIIVSQQEAANGTNYVTIPELSGYAPFRVLYGSTSRVGDIINKPFIMNLSFVSDTGYVQFFNLTNGETYTHIIYMEYVKI